MPRLERGLLIGVAGRMYAGKTTCSSYLLASGAWSRIRFAGPLKAIAGAIFKQLGHSDEEIHAMVDGCLKQRWIATIGMTPRMVMQYIGSEYRTLIHQESLWCDIAMARSRYLRNSGRNVVIDDVRFKDPEMLQIRKASGLLWCVRRPDAKSPEISDASLSVMKSVDERAVTVPVSVANFRPIFYRAFMAVMQPIWPYESNQLVSAAHQFSVEFLENVFLPKSTKTPPSVAYSGTSHVSEADYPDSDFDRVFINDGDLSSFRRNISDAIARIDLKKSGQTS